MRRVHHGCDPTAARRCAPPEIGIRTTLVPRPAESRYIRRVARTADGTGYARWRRRLAFAVAFAAAWASALARASDAPGQVVVEWVAPDSCPDAAHVQQEVDRLLSDVSVRGDAYLRAHAEVSREKSGVWRVNLQTTGVGGPGRRSVTAESCAALAAATALILALALPLDSRGIARRAADGSSLAPATAATPVVSEASGPAPAKAPAPVVSEASGPAPAKAPAPVVSEASGRSPAKAPAPVVAEANGAAPATAATPEVAGTTLVVTSGAHGAMPRPWQSPPRRVGFATAASAVVDMGTLPTAAPGVAATLALIPGAFRALRLEVGAALFLTERTTSPAARSGTFSLRTGDVGGCLVTTLGTLEVGACPSVEMAWLSAAGLYETVRSHGNAEWVVLRARATLAFPFSSAWAIRADLGGGLDMTRPQFVSAGAEQGLIGQPARFTGRGALGLELRF
jgi:hypothetical protein